MIPKRRSETNFTRLPNETLGLIISYLQLFDLAQLDMSLTNQSARNQLKSTIFCSAQYNCKNLNQPTSPSLLKWLINRNVISFELYLREDVDSSLLSNLHFPLLRELDVSGNMNLTDENVCIIAKGCPYLTEITLRCCRSITNKSVKHLVEYCPHIKHLDISDCKITDESLRYLRELNQLKEINLELCDQISDVGLIFLSTDIQFSLRHLNLRYTNITDNGLSHLTISHKEIIYLNLEHCHHITTDGIQSVFDELLLIQHLYISTNSRSSVNMIQIIANSRVTDSFHLKSLRLGFGCTVNYFSMLDFIQNCFHLEHIDLGRCDGVTDTTIFPIASHCPLLKSIYLRQCELTDIAIIALGERCLYLEKMVLRGCYRLTDAAIIGLSKTCPDLKSLDLADCMKLSDEALIGLAEGCGMLSELNLFHLIRITDNGLMALADGCPSLTSLDICCCWNITDTGLNYLLMQVAALSHINVMATGLESDVSLRNFPPTLTSLYIDHAINMTNHSLILLGNRCKDLKLLVMRRCDQIEADALEQFSIICRHLTKLDISECRHLKSLNRDTLTNIFRNCPVLPSITLDNKEHRRAYRYDYELLS
jgi:hypothetical protein